ncbi:hypothetical protein BZB76_6544 [Actinomadura pelletieri DSM 43383]|uniref:Uncharacterized protein n=1 Tax=Actinomadura pelletieri DSM 43383 TaxID=1120940 RepID=A0A495Q9X1_9ACTN|nr:hypothetical protein [Actinomadura pelletieri]RKS68283.1 hypothetical protein BZB76_6544 [Actinomadura pelletieri DSM 43383]
MNTLDTAALRVAFAVHDRGRRLAARLRGRGDRGSGVVETIIIVAGFAGLAFVVYLAVSSKVHAWINKIPGASGP